MSRTSTIVTPPQNTRIAEDVKGGVEFDPSQKNPSKFDDKNGYPEKNKIKAKTVPTTAPVSSKADMASIRPYMVANLVPDTKPAAVPAAPAAKTPPPISSLGGSLKSDAAPLNTQVLGEQNKPAPVPAAKPAQLQPYASVEQGFAESDSTVGNNKTHVSSTGTAIKVGAVLSNKVDISFTNFNRNNQVDTNGIKSATHFRDNALNINAPLKDGWTAYLNFRDRSREDLGKTTSADSIRIRPSISKKFGDADRGGAFTARLDAGYIFGNNRNNGAVTSSTFTQQYTLGGIYDVSLLPKASPTKLNLVTTTEVRGQISSTGANGIGLAQSVDLKLKAPLLGGSFLARAGLVFEKGGQPDALWGTELSPLGGFSVDKIVTVGWEKRW